MNSFPVMDWNSKWDWENLDMFSSKASGSPKKLQVTYWGIEEGDIDNGSFNLSGGGGGSGGSASDVGHGSSAKSSISASTDCSSKDGMKTSNFTFETVGGFPGYFSNKNELAKPERLSPPMEASVGSGEQLIGLKLGKRTYFENSGAKTASLSTVPVSSASTAKKTKSSSQCGPMPRCQVEGCNLDLSSAKEYHRKHRVCESHSKSSKVVVGGQERRFCQQCSRFHSLSEFDEKKRSCRRRLSDHNARRRKPQQETIQFNSTKLSSSFYEGRQQMSFVLNNAPHAHTRPTANLSWESANPKFALTKGYLLKPEKGGVIDGHPQLPGIQLPHALSMSSHDSNKLSQCKGTTTEAFDQGFKESMFSSSLDAAPDLRRALSLLSTNSWGQLEPESATLQHPTHINHTNMPQHVLPVTSHTSLHYWPADQQSSGPHMHVLAANSNGNSHYQEIQLFKSPYETSFYSNPLN